MSINIKKSKRGSLHKALGVPQGEKIPASKLSDNGVSSILLVNRALYGEEQVFLIREQLL